MCSVVVESKRFGSNLIREKLIPKVKAAIPFPLVPFRQEDPIEPISRVVSLHPLVNLSLVEGSKSLRKRQQQPLKIHFAATHLSGSDEEKATTQ